MTNSPIFLQKLLLMSLGVVVMTVFMVASARADDRVTRNHSFDLRDINDVEISNGVGSIDIVPIDGDELRLVLDLEGKRQGFFRRKVDVGSLDIEVKERGDTLFLSFEEEDVIADWVVELPNIARAIIELGVGELRMEVDETDLDIEMGVGDINVEAPLESVGRINVNVGVGDANVHGAQILDNKSAFISQSIRAQGEGTHPLEIDLGVGDLSVRLAD